MIDLVFAASISIILFWSALSVYDFFYINKNKNELQLKVNDTLRAISLEIKNNVSFDIINDLEKEKIYFLHIEKIEDLIESDFKNLIKTKFINGNEFWSLNIVPIEFDNILNVEIRYVNVSNNINYEKMEVIKKFAHIK